MKKSDLIEVIRKVVRKEVKAALKEELGKKQASSNGEFGKMMEHAEELFNKKEYTKNPILNEALNPRRYSELKYEIYFFNNIIIYFIRCSCSGHLCRYSNKLSKYW